MTQMQSYCLAEGVAIRAERFGALVYRYDTRRLYFIHSRNVADFVAALDGTVPLDVAIASFIDRHHLPNSMRQTLQTTIERLERIGLVQAATTS